MAKTRIGERLSKVATESISSTSVRKGDRISELDKLNVKFEEFCKQFKPLTTALKNHVSNLENLEKSQGAVLVELSKWTQGTPILGANQGTNPIVLQKALLQKDGTYSHLYLKDIVEYVKDWEMVLETRVMATQKQVKALQVSLDHYEKKLAALVQAHDATVAKGKSAPKRCDTDKVHRNEEKLAFARNNYENEATKLCNMIEAVVDDAWKDLLPLLLRMLKMDSNIIDAKKMLLDSNEAISNLQNLAKEYNIDVTTPPPGPITKEKKKTTMRSSSSTPPFKEQ